MRAALVLVIASCAGLDARIPDGDANSFISSAVKRPKNARARAFNRSSHVDFLLKLASAGTQQRWQQFLQRRRAWPLEPGALRRGAPQPQDQLLPPLRPWRHTLSPVCWNADWSPSDCCFFQPMDTALGVCFANDTDMFMDCCPWETVEEMQSSMLACDLSPDNSSWRQIQRAFDGCVGPDEARCLEQVALRFPLHHDPLCAMGAAIGGIFLSAHKPYNEFEDSNAILPDGRMQGFDECLLYGIDQASCCVKVRFCKCNSHPADNVGCNLGVAVECAICLMLIPAVLLKQSGWGKMLAWIVEDLQRLSIGRSIGRQTAEPTELLRSAVWGQSGDSHAALLRLSNASGPLGERLSGAVVEDFFTQAMASRNPMDAWAASIETGVLQALADFLKAPRAPHGRRPPVPMKRLEAIDKLIPRNLRSIVPKQFLVTQGSRARALRGMMGPQRLERQRGGLLEAAWTQALRSWPGLCCPPDATGALALLHPPPAGNAKWPALLLALCLACEARDRRLLAEVERGIQCLGQGCTLLMRLQIQEQHVWNLWKDPAAKRWLPLLQLVLDRFLRPKTAKAPKAMQVLTTTETLSFLKAGGSMARFGDGEFWSLDRAHVTPVQRNRFLQESLIYVARLGTTGCPGFKPAMVDVLGSEESFPDRLNFNWWRDRPFFRQVPFRYFPPGRYGNMWVNYRPGQANRDVRAMQRFVQGWEEVFANKSVLLVGHPFAQAATAGQATGVMFAAAVSEYDFPVRVAQLSWRMMRQVATERLAPFGRARDVRLMRPLAVALASSVRWHGVLDTVREVVDHSDIDVVAVSWGPQAKPLVADVACRGTQAVDVGRLLWELHGIRAMSGELLQPGKAGEKDWIAEGADGLSLSLNGSWWLRPKSPETLHSPRKGSLPSLLEESRPHSKKSGPRFSSPAFHRASAPALHRRVEASQGLFERPISPSNEPGPHGRRSDYEEACAKSGLLPKFARAVQERRGRDTLDLSGLGFGDLQLRAMLCDRQLLPAPLVRRWRLRDARLSGAGVEALSAKLAPQTEMLDLARNEMGAKGVHSLASCLRQRLLPQLRWLDLSMNGLRDGALWPLTDGLLSCPHLVRLELNHNCIEEGGALGELLGTHNRLARLSLHSNALSGAALFEGLLANARCGQLSDLDVAWNHLGPSSACALGAALRSSVGLYHLDLSYNNLGPSSCQAIADGLRDNHHLYGLHIVGNAATIDADGFLSANFARTAPPNRPQALFGELRQGIDGRVGAARPSRDPEVLETAWTDEEVLRERDVLEQRSTCWACEGWQCLELAWPLRLGETPPKAVWCFTSIDGFRSGLRLRRDPPEGPPLRFFAARMVPRSCKILAIFQVDSALLTSGATEMLAAPVEIELRACEELPLLEPEDFLRKEVVRRKGELEHHFVLRMDRACVVRDCAEHDGSHAAHCHRTVLLDGPNGVPVQMPRITESEFRMRTKVPRGRPFYADFCGETPARLRDCFLLDWSRAKVARIAKGEADLKAAEESALAQYRRVLALYRASGERSVGTTQLEASGLFLQAGLVDDTTRVADIDRCFIAAKVLPFDLRKGVKQGGDKVLCRHQFLEMLLRVADQRFVKTGRIGLAEATASLMQALAPAADPKVRDLDLFHQQFHTEQVDDVMKKHHAILQEVYRRFSGRVAHPGAERFMSLAEFQDLLDTIKPYNSEFSQRRCGWAFRLAMMTQPEELFETRFQEMSFLEFQHAVGVVTFLRQRPTDMAEALETFIQEKLLPVGKEKRPLTRN
ncbi:unnamed protein product [Effrenium voratum]|uniref:Uncharacterized protein n=1 Tax=Effrenium voratum TaxID=2562239 RepID=A0AA36N726_9DINO|nr:unnamed protein product [Effrenium voratum]